MLVWDWQAGIWPVDLGIRAARHGWRCWVPDFLGSLATRVDHALGEGYSGGCGQRSGRRLSGLASAGTSNVVSRNTRTKSGAMLVRRSLPHRPKPPLILVHLRRGQAAPFQTQSNSKLSAACEGEIFQRHRSSELLLSVSGGKIPTLTSQRTRGEDGAPSALFHPPHPFKAHQAMARTSGTPDYTC